MKKSDEERERTCSLPEAGYRGQSYEVRAVDGNGLEFVVGWTNDPDGAPLVGMVDLHPVWNKPKVFRLRKQSRGRLDT